MLALVLLALVLPACAQDEVRVDILSPAPGAVVTGGVVRAGRSLYVLACQKVTVEDREHVYIYCVLQSVLRLRARRRA